MKLTEQIVDFVHGQQAILMGTRDANLKGYSHRIAGIKVSSDRETITVYPITHGLDRLLHNLEENGHFALSFTELPSQQSMQLKGKYISSRACDPQDEVIQSIYLNKFKTGLKMMGVPEAHAETLVFGPCAAITLEVLEVYDQTPAPGAGKKIM